MTSIAASSRWAPRLIYTALHLLGSKCCTGPVRATFRDEPSDVGAQVNGWARMRILGDRQLCRAERTDPARFRRSSLRMAPRQDDSLGLVT